MHMAGIPYATGCKRGLSTQVSMGGALKALGLERLPDLQNLMMSELEKAAAASRSLTAISKAKRGGRTSRPLHRDEDEKARFGTRWAFLLERKWSR